MEEKTSGNKSNIFVTTVDISIAEAMVADLQAQGFSITKPLYTVFSAKKKGLSCTLYQSGKLMVQGKDTPAFLEFYLEPQILGSFVYTYGELEIDKTNRIGIDESGKGDFFGPLCIAGVFAEGEGILNLKKLGVCDSKAISDSNILSLGKKIRKQYSHYVIKLKPFKYNELYKKFGNLNHLLAWGHAATIGALVEKTGCKNVWIDQFAREHVVEMALKRNNLKVDLTQKHRGEEDLVVAAASILAREAFLEGLDELSREYELKLPKGASTAVIRAAESFIRKHGQEVFSQVAKLHFKTATTVLSKLQYNL
jgi:ribonuclease HIII